MDQLMEAILLACKVAITSLKVLKDENMAENAAGNG